MEGMNTQLNFDAFRHPVSYKEAELYYTQHIAKVNKRQDRFILNTVTTVIVLFIGLFTVLAVYVSDGSWSVILNGVGVAGVVLLIHLLLMWLLHVIAVNQCRQYVHRD